jgi:hypothetical protein
MVARLLMKKSIVVVFLAVNYAVASGLVYVTFRRYPDHSTAATIQWMLLYLVSVIYPIGWTMQQLKAIRKLGLEDSRVLRRQAWAPVIVGGTTLLIALSLLFPLLR